MEFLRGGFKLKVREAVGDLIAGRDDGSITFGPLTCRLSFRRVSEKAHDVASSAVKGWRWEPAEVETPVGSGPGFRAELSAVPGLPARIVWEAALLDSGELVARISLENLDSHAFRVDELCPLTYRGADPGLDMGAGYLTWRIYRTGYQSWSPAGSIGVMEPDYRPRFFLPSRSGMNPRTPYSDRPGEKAVDWMAQVVEPKLKLSALLGFITSGRHSGRVEFEVKYDRFRKWEAISDGEGAVLSAGETAASEWCLLSFSREPLAQQARYYELWGQAMSARKSPPLSGWASWYFSFWNVSEEIVDKNLAAMKEFRGLADAVQIDEGFERWVGEWKNWNPKFHSPPSRIAARIREQGFRPGLWLAPFLVSQEAPLYRRHKDWALRDKRGWPVVAFIHPQGAGHLIYALDATHPGVQAWLRDTVKTVAQDFGFEFLKLDFLYAASLPGVRHDRKATGASALRQGLEIIRAAAGEGTYILGCGCPLGPAIGLVDAMRVSQDVDIRWKLPIMDAVAGVPAGPGAGNCLKNDLARLLMHRRLWVNDPDCVVMRETKAGLRPHEIQSELTVFYLTGGLTILSEDLTRLPPPRLEWFRRMLPPSAEAALPLDLLERDFPETLLLKKNDSALVARFNWSAKARELKLSLAELGLAGPHHVFDFWAEKYLGVIESEKSLGRVPGRGCKYLRLAPVADRPLLLATNLHLGMGEVGIESRAEGNALKVRVQLPGRRQGQLWAVFPEGRVVEKPIAFQDEWEGLIE